METANIHNHRYYIFFGILEDGINWFHYQIKNIIFSRNPSLNEL